MFFVPGGGIDRRRVRKSNLLGLEKTNPSMTSLTQMWPLSPPGSTFSISATEMPSYNDAFGQIPPDCASNVNVPDALRSDPECPCGRFRRERERIFATYCGNGREYRARRPTSTGPDGSGECSPVFTRNRSVVAESDWNSCISATNGEMSSCDYPMSYRNAPYLPLAMSKASPKGLRPRDYRWNLIHQPPAIGDRRNRDR